MSESFTLLHEFLAEVTIRNPETGIKIDVKVSGTQRCLGFGVLQKGLETEYNVEGKSWIRTLNIKQHCGSEVINIDYRYDWQDPNGVRTGNITSSKPGNGVVATPAASKPRIRVKPGQAEAAFGETETGEEPFFYLGDVDGLEQIKPELCVQATGDIKSFTEVSE